MRSFVCLGLSAALLLGGVVAPALFGLSDAKGQSAADKATARTLATEGIKLYRAGKHAEALDKLERAQKLYDAPPHLLYIARSQVALGKLVEGAETYRTLVRTNLPAGSPPAFKQAIDDGKKDLQELEPKIPAVRIGVKPENTSGVEIRIDDERVPAEVVGAERPINPGQHTIKVSAPGFETAEQTVEIKPGEKKPVNFELTPGTGGPPVATAPAGPTPTPGPGQEPPPGGPAPEPQPAATEGGKVGFMLGLRLGGAFPFGDAFHGTVANPDETLKMADLYGAGGGLELHAGLRFAKYFTAKLMFGGYGFAPGDRAQPQGTPSDNTTSAASAGIGAQIGTPRGKFGGFGEFGLLFLNNFVITNDLQAPANCTITTTSKGTALWLGGGLSIPLSPSWALTPVLSSQFGRFTEQEVDEDCGAGISGGDIPSGDQRTHGMLFLGIGGEFLFGPDKPVK